MLRLFLLILALTGLVVAHPQDTVNRVDTLGRKQGYWKKFDNEGLLVYQGQFRDDIPYGKFVYFYPDGLTRTVSEVSGNGRIAHTTSYFRNGKRMAIGTYVDQQRDSLWRFFSEQDGSLISEEFYLNGTKHGPEKIFYPGKGVAEILPWVNGVLEGKWEQFYDDGTPKLTGSYKNGEKEGPLKTFFFNGNLLLSGFYANGHQDSTWIFYDDQGSVTMKEYYEDGILLKSEQFGP